MDRDFGETLPESSAASETLVVNEIYLSLQGESTFAGLPCVFVRLTACDLRCSYCDTAYAFREGKRMAAADVQRRVSELAAPFAGRRGSCRLPLVELTGGEPLLQKGTPELLRKLCEEGYEVLLETSGAHDLSPVDLRVHRIMDLKCPSSGETLRNRWENIPLLTATDEVKFVIGTEQDYEWAKAQIIRWDLARICPILFSWVSPLEPRQQDPSLKKGPANQRPISRVELANAIVADALPVRFQLQMHKFIWPPAARGV